MKPVLSVENMRKTDLYAVKSGVSGRELTRRAGEGLFRNIVPNGPVGVVCGSGNNAGDGYVLAKLLHDNGVDCTIFRLSEKFSEDGGYFYKICADAGIKTVICDEKTDFNGFETIADCIFGTGFSGRVEGLARTIIRRINESSSYVVSADINSGLNGDSGLAELCVESDLTVAIGGFKPGHFLNMAKDKIKKKVNCDIGVIPQGRPYMLAEKEDVAGLIRRRPNFSHKGTYGYSAIVGGSLKYPGAVKLASMADAAMKSGAGVVKIAVPESVCRSLIPDVLESTLYPLPDRDGEMIFSEDKLSELCGSVGTMAFGPGTGESEETRKILRYLLKNFEGKLIIDAGGLTTLSAFGADVLRTAKCSVVLTPHVKEFSRLIRRSASEILNSPINFAEKCARESGAVVLLKGPSTIITDGGRTYIVDAGSPGMATAGSGDVLTGIITAASALVRDLPKAAVLSAYVNGKAGEYAAKEVNEVSMTAKDTVRQIPKVISELLSESGAAAP